MKHFHKLLLAACGCALLASAASAQAPGSNSPWNTQWSIPLDSIKRTYALGYVGLVPASSATDVWQICGSSSATIRITRVSIGGRATAATTMDVALILRSAANTGGTIEADAPFSGAAIPGWSYDTSQSTGTALVTAWTANPTVGAAVGTIVAGQVPIGNLTTGTADPQVNFDFGSRPARAVVLHGTSQCLSVNLNGSTYSGGLLDISTEWTEE